MVSTLMQELYCLGVQAIMEGQTILIGNKCDKEVSKFGEFGSLYNTWHISIDMCLVDHSVHEHQREEI